MMSIFSKFDDARSAFAALANAGRDPFGVRFDRIARDLGLDAVAILDVVMDIEDHFDISTPFDRIGDITTVKDLCRPVEAHLKDRG